MSPTRIGSDGVVRLDDPGDAVAVAHLDQLDRPLGLVGRRARRLAVEDRQLQLRPEAHAPGQVGADLAPAMIDVRDVAVGLVEGRLVPLDLFADIADRLLRQGQPLREVFLLLANLRLEVGDLGDLLGQLGLILVDLGDQAPASCSCLVCSASRSVLLSLAALAATSSLLWLTLLADSNPRLTPI